LAKNPSLDVDLIDYIDKVIPVASLRARYVIKKILKDGVVNSESIRNRGYVHGARAVGDVRDQGIPLQTKNIKSSKGKSIAQYTFGKATEIKYHKFGGRVSFPKTLKKTLIEETGLICGISKQKLPIADLQIDHRIPYYISGDISGERNIEDFMLLSRSMQRSKSWACENCKNILEYFKVETCKNCYWASPENYEHIAMKKERRIDLVFSEEETTIFDTIKQLGAKEEISMQDIIKSALESYAQSLTAI
jgi:hypothetical protein